MKKRLLALLFVAVAAMPAGVSAGKGWEKTKTCLCKNKGNITFSAVAVAGLGAIGVGLIQVFQKTTRDAVIIDLKAIHADLANKQFKAAWAKTVLFAKKNPLLGVAAFGALLEAISLGYFGGKLVKKLFCGKSCKRAGTKTGYFTRVKNDDDAEDEGGCFLKKLLTCKGKEDTDEEGGCFLTNCFKSTDKEKVTEIL